MSATENIYQLKIQLKGIKPDIWRRIQISADNNFAELHLAIQVAMGWSNIHLHEFKARNPRTNMVEYITNKEIVESWIALNMTVINVDEKERKLSDYLIAPYDKIIYEYDFQDGWIHDVILQKILPAKPRVQYPILVTGKRACPTEQCGGVNGYKELLKILKNPSHKDYEKCVQKIRNQGYVNFNPNEFKLQAKNLYAGILDQINLLQLFDCII